MNLLEVRTKLAAVLTPVEDDDPAVLTGIVDALEPPALMLGWNDPWIMPAGMCSTTAHLIVMAVAQRISPGDGLTSLEGMIDYTLERIRGDSEEWQLVQVSGPRILLIGKTNYLASRIELQVTVDG